MVKVEEKIEWCKVLEGELLWNHAVVCTLDDITILLEIYLFQKPVKILYSTSLCQSREPYLYNKIILITYQAMCLLE